MPPVVNPIGVELDETARRMRIRWDDGHLGDWSWIGASPSLPLRAVRRGRHAAGRRLAGDRLRRAPDDDERSALDRPLRARSDLGRRPRHRPLHVHEAPRPLRVRRAPRPGPMIPTPDFRDGFTLALGGGGGRGWAHLGVARALEAHGLPPARIVGTSMGAIIGAALAAGRTPAEIEDAGRRLSLYRNVRRGRLVAVRPAAGARPPCRRPRRPANRGPVHPPRHHHV